MHCPKFGEDRTVAVPIPQPTSILMTDDYKLQLSFDGNRITTPWFPLLGKRAPEAPILRVELTRSGDAVVGATASIHSLPRNDPKHQVVREEFADAARWPKHLLVSYTWHNKHAVDSHRGLMIVLGVGVSWAFLILLMAWTAHRKHLHRFLENMESSQGLVSTPAFPSQKAE